MKKTNPLQGTLLVVIIAAILLFVNLIANQEYVKIDLTKQKLFTLDHITGRFLENLSDNCNITVYLSKDLPSTHQNLERLVRDKLDSFKEFAGDKLHYRIIRVSEGDTAMAGELRDEGIRQVQVGEQTKTKVGVQLIWKSAKIDYLGGKSVVILNDRTLEYDILSAVKTLSSGMKKKVGVLISFADPKLEEQDKKGLETRVDQLWDRIAESYPGTDKTTFLKTKIDEYENSLPQERKARFLNDFSSAGVFMMLSQHFDIEVLDISEKKDYRWERITDTIKNMRSENPMRQEDKSTVLARMFGRPFEEIPEELDLLLVYQPKFALEEENLKLVNDFVMKGKPAFFLVDQTRGASMYNTQFGLDRELDVNSLLEPYGVRVENALVLDKECVQKEMPILENMRLRSVPVFSLHQPILYKFDRDNPITSNFKAMAFDTVSPVDASHAESNETVTVMELLTSSENARIETGNDMGGPGKLIPLPMVQELDGQPFDDSFVPLAVALEGSLPNPYAETDSAGVVIGGVAASPENTRLVVVGDADFINMGAGDNFNFLLNSMEWLTNDEFSLASLRGREFMLNMITGEISSAAETWIQIVDILLMPLLILLISLGGYFYRINRKKRMEIAA